MERKKKPRPNTISAMVAAAGGDPKDHYVDENSWLEVIDYAKNLDLQVGVSKRKQWKT